MSIPSKHFKTYVDNEHVRDRYTYRNRLYFSFYFRLIFLYADDFPFYVCVTVNFGSPSLMT